GIPVAAVGMVSCDGAAFKSERPRGLVVHAAAEAVAAVASVGAIAAEGVVVADGGVEDECGAAIPEAAAQAVAGAAAARPGGAPLGLVGGDGAALDREPRLGAGVRRVGRSRPVVHAAAEAVAAIAGRVAVASLRPVVGQRAARDDDDAPKDIRYTAPQ